MSIWRHVRAIALLPAMVTLVIPGCIAYLTRSVHVGWGLSGPVRFAPAVAGGALAAGGVGLIASTVTLLATAGRGTLAPWDPTQRLVVRGVYRHVRNPMITGVLGVLLAEATLLGSLPLLSWSGAFFAANALYIPLVEERGLERRFGEEYRLYRQHVPRWVPRLTPWRPQFEGDVREG